ncbi:cadherin EGF LAG seven-pass G-type receptor 2-like [Tubulanus polymorphus]|uniref:cadherin EGF LAG seven-pass G-type receptor 2-like n=1 Tax=Tubulanus polymorphus TaxID=672921 RepID=UPI003DA32B9E
MSVDFSVGFMNYFRIIFIVIFLIPTSVWSVVPVFTGNPATGSIDENVTVATTVLALGTFKTAGTPNFYSMTVTPNDGKFALDASNGALSCIANPGFDYETQTSYTFSLTATDGVDTSSAVAFTLDINDINEPPIITNLPNSVVIPEISSVSKSIFKVLVNDPESNTTEWAFSFESIWPPDGVDKFSIDKTGVVSTTATATDYELTKQYWLTTKMTDGVWTTSASILYVDIFNVNEAPILNTTNYQLPQEIAIYEETPIGTTLAIDPIGAYDVDAGDTITFELEGRDHEFFQLVKGAGDRVYLTVAKRIDFESKTPYLDSQNRIKLYVWARDNHQLRNVNNGYITMYIKIMDINDNLPVCFPDSYTATITENTAINTEVLQVQCYDADASSPLVFTVNGTVAAQQWFQVLSNGSLTVKHPSDLETDTTLSFYVYGYQGTYPNRTSTRAAVAITIRAVNDNKPVFKQSFYNFEARSDASVAHSVGVISATDADITTSVISYDWVSSITLFSLGSADGIIRVLNPLTDDKKYIYFAVAKDNDVPPDYSEHTAIRIDTFPPDAYLVNFDVTRPLTYFTPSRQQEFIDAVTSGCGGCLARLSSLKSTPGAETTSTTLTMYALKDNTTESYANIDQPKIFLGKSELLNTFTVNADGQPSSATTLPGFSNYPVTKVYSASATSLTAIEWLVTTPGGQAVIALLSIIALALLITGLVYFFKWCVPKMRDVKCPKANCDCCKREPKPEPPKKRLHHPDGDANVFDFRYRADQPLYKPNNLG